MKIGIDLDGVIFDTESFYRFYADVWDVKHHGLDNILDNSAATFQERFNWDDNEMKEFYDKYASSIIKNTGLKPGVSEVLNYLNNQGYDLYVISKRGFYNEKEIDITQELFKKFNLDFFKECIFKADDKKKIVLKNKFDYVIDDNLNICNSMKDICKTIYFRDVYSKISKDEKIYTVCSWQDIYRYFKKEKCDNDG